MLLSVVIPVYNCEKYVSQCVYSVLSQPCSDQIEIIVVDDGSTDESGAICDRIADKHSNVTVIHKDNGGVSSARNAGIERVTGEYIAFLDGDDYWEKNFFDEDIVQELNKKYDLYGFTYNYVIGDKYYKSFSTKTELKNYDKDGRGKCDFNYHWTYLFKRAILEENKLTYPLGIAMSEDMSFLEKYCYFIRTYQRINKIMYNYRKNVDSITQTIDLQKAVENFYKAYSELGKWYKSIGEDYNLDAMCGRLFSNMLDGLCGEHSYRYCKNYIDNDARFHCINNYKNIGMSKRYYPKVERFMEHKFRFWLFTKIKYKVRNFSKFLLSKTKLLKKLYEYVAYVKLRGYKKIED